MNSAFIRRLFFFVIIILLNLLKTIAQVNSPVNEKDTAKKIIFNQQNISTAIVYKKDNKFYINSTEIKYEFHSGSIGNRSTDLSVIKYIISCQTVDATVYYDCSLTDTVHICKEGNKIDLICIGYTCKDVWKVLNYGTENEMSKVTLYSLKNQDKIIEGQYKYYYEELPNGNDYLLLGYSNTANIDSNSNTLGTFYYSINGDPCKEIKIKTKNRNLIQEVWRNNANTCKIINPFIFKPKYDFEDTFCQKVYHKYDSTKSVSNTSGLGLEVEFSYKKNNKWIDKKIKAVINKGVAEKDVIYID